MAPKRPWLRLLPCLLVALVAVAVAVTAGCGDPKERDTFALRVTVAGAGRVTSSPWGIDCGATCSSSFAAGTGVTLTAVAAPGAVFTGWSGDCSGSDGNASVALTAARSCTAAFAPEATVVLDVVLAGDGRGRVTSSPAGIDCGNACSASFAGGSRVTLTAQPTAPSLFAGWSGDCAGSAATTTVALDAARRCTATFTTLDGYTLDVARAGGGGGTVTSSPVGIDCGAACSALFAAGSDVTLTAAPAAGSVFGGWSGDCAGTSTTATVAMTAARSCTATFTPNTYALTVVASGAGSGRVVSLPAGIDCGATCTAPLAGDVTLVATPAVGSIFAGWSGDCAGTSPGATLTMTAAKSCTAAFDVGVSRLPFPQMPGHGQPPLTRLQLVTVTFAGYPYQSFVESFGDFVVGSKWLAAVTQDFGPISATHLAKVQLPASAASMDYGSIVQQNIGGLLPYPTDATGLVYLFYQPTPCSGGGGYHSTLTTNGMTVAYGVALNCNDGQSAVGVASHEIAEILTDPYLNGQFFDGSTLPWIGEVGDICNSAPWWLEGGYRFEPSWSNVAAAGGGSPCVPFAPGHVYYNVSPSPSAPQTVPAGGSVTFTLTGWATAPVAPWSLVVNPDGYAQQGFATTPSFTSTTVGNGTTTQLTLHVPASTPSGRTATVRVGSVLPDVVGGVSGFAGDWSLQVIAQ